MPNHCDNVLSVVGSETQVDLFLELSRTPRPLTGDPPGSFGYQDPDEHREPTIFDFHGTVPLPVEYSEVPYGDFSAPVKGYDMEVEAWGVKWGPYNVEEDCIQRPEHGRADIYFTTAWGPPVEWMKKASALFPNLQFLLSYGGEGPIRGRIMCQWGEVIEDRADDWESFCRPYRDDMTSDEEEELYESNYEAQRHLIDTHDEWVKE